MTFQTFVKMNGVYYPAGTEFAEETPKTKPSRGRQKAPKAKPQTSKTEG